MNLYEILGVKKTASLSDIKRSYRMLSKQYHPDHSTGMENKFQEIKGAYEILSNPDRRERYDRTGRVDDVKVTPRDIQTVIEQTMLIVITATRPDGSTDDPTWEDILGKIKTSITGLARQQLVDQVREEKRKLDRIDNLAKRFKSKTDADPVGDALAAHRRTIYKDYCVAQDRLELNYKTEEAIAAYDYVTGEVEPEPEGQYDPNSTARLSGPRLQLAGPEPL